MEGKRREKKRAEGPKEGRTRNQGEKKAPTEERANEERENGEESEKREERGKGVRGKKSKRGPTFFGLFDFEITNVPLSVENSLSQAFHDRFNGDESR